MRGAFIPFPAPARPSDRHHPAEGADRRRRLIDLEDFGAASRPDTESIPTEAQTPPDDAGSDPERVTMSREDVESLRRAAFQEGLETGARNREDVLTEQHASCVASLNAAFAAENARRRQVMDDAAHAFVATVVDIVRGLTALDGAVLAGLRRDLVADAEGFVRECEGTVTIRCDEAHEQRLASIVKADGDVRIEPVLESEPEAGSGMISVTSAATTIVIDPEQWRKSVAEKIVAAVTALAEQRAERGRQKA